ncbi:MAG: hypothetical protein ACFFBD_26045 [Candidatus Hodarchaeota archaeon]
MDSAFRYKMDQLRIIEAIEAAKPLIDVDILQTTIGFLASGSYTQNNSSKNIVIWFPNPIINSLLKHKKLILDSPLKQDFLTTLLAPTEPLKRQEYFPSTYAVVIGLTTSMMNRFATRLDHEIRQTIDSFNNAIAKITQTIHDLFPFFQRSSFNSSSTKDSSSPVQNYYTLKFIPKQSKSSHIPVNMHQYRILDPENLPNFIKKLNKQGFEIHRGVNVLKETN